MGSRWLPAAAVTLLAAVLAWLNRGERVALDLGVATFYRAPLTVVLFLAFLAGMLSMLWLSLRHDRRVRDELRRHGLLQPAAPPAFAASAWGPAREPAPAQEQAPALPRAEGLARDEERTAAFSSGEEERTAAFSSGEEERTAAYPLHGEHTSVLPRDEERTVAYPGDEERTAHSRDEERTIGYPRLDEDRAT